MKIKALLTAVTLTLALTAQADVLVYKATCTGRIVGANSDQRITGVGYLVWDPDNAEVQLILGYKQGGAKLIDQTTWDVSVSRAIGKNGLRFTSFSYDGTDTDREFYIMGYGSETSLVMSPTRTISAPRSMTAKPQILDSLGTDYATFSGLSMTMSFSPKDTQNANIAQSTIDQVISQYKAKLVSQGYTP